MALQFKTSLRNAWLDLIESSIGASPVLKIRTGAPPADCAAVNTGTALSTITLPADWMNAAASGSKTKLGTWQDASADASGTPGHFRLYASDGTTCWLQGTVTVEGDGGDMTINRVPIDISEPVTVVTFSLTAPGA